MPTSKLSAALPVILTLTEATRGMDRFEMLDVGPGHGKYGLLAREYLPNLGLLDAVEAESRYITPLLWEIYDTVICDDVRHWHEEQLDYDVVLMADVIEHMPISEGLQLLQRTPGHVVVTTPRRFFQNPEAAEGWPTEVHHCVWTRDLFDGMQRCRRVTLLPEEVLLAWLGPL